MKLIYKASDITEAHIVSGLLKANNIDAHVGGYYLQGGVGDLAAMDFVTIHVADEDVNSAKSIITEYENTNNKKQYSAKHHTNVFTIPLIIIAFSFLMMIILAIVFSGE